MPDRGVISPERTVTGAPVWVGGALTRKRTPSSSLFQRAMASSSPRDAVSAAPIRLAATFVYIFALIQAGCSVVRSLPTASHSKSCVPSARRTSDSSPCQTPTVRLPSRKVVSFG
ncbi:hypothetical protein D9M72_488940 [compost metagenome]